MAAKFRHLCRKLGSQSKNLTSDFAPEVSKYTQTPQKTQVAQNGDLDNYCVTLVSDAACEMITYKLKPLLLTHPHECMCTSFKKINLLPLSRHSSNITIDYYHAFSLLTSKCFQIDSRLGLFPIVNCYRMTSYRLDLLLSPN